MKKLLILGLLVIAGTVEAKPTNTKQTICKRKKGTPCQLSETRKDYCNCTIPSYEDWGLPGAQTGKTYNLSGANFSGARFSSYSFAKGAEAKEASKNYLINLSKANFSGAIFSSYSFNNSNVNLSGANFSGARFSNYLFYNSKVNLSRANFSGAQGGNQLTRLKQLSKSISNRYYWLARIWLRSPGR